MRNCSSVLCVGVLTLSMFAGAAWAQKAEQREYADFIEWARANGYVTKDSPRAQGDPIENFPNTWALNTIGVAFDKIDPTQMWYFHESDPNPGIWMVDIAAGHAASAFTYSKLGGPNTDGGAVRLGDGFIYSADFNGDLATIDDNIYLFDRSGSTVAFWETDVGLSGAPCSGGSVNLIIDVAIDPNDPGIVYATNASDNLIYRVDVSNTSGGSGSPSPCAITGTFSAPAVLGVIMGIEYDVCNDGYWLTSFANNTIVLVANDGTFGTVLESFNGSAGGGFNTGIAAQQDGANPLPVWVTDFGSNATAVIDSGTTGCFVPVELESFSAD